MTDQLLEKYNVPVLVRITTRLAHSRSGVVLREKLQQKKLSIPADPLRIDCITHPFRAQYTYLNSSHKFRTCCTPLWRTP